MISIFKPNLYPNNKTDGTEIDWHERIVFPHQWYVSEKLEGIRVELCFDPTGVCTIRTRSMKRFRSVWMKSVEADLQGCGLKNCIVEGEVYCHGMRFNEIQHFIGSGDVRTAASIKKVIREQHTEGKFADRSVQWLSTYHMHDFQINIFDIWRNEDKTFHDRLFHLRMAYIVLEKFSDKFTLITQMRCESVDHMKSLYHNIVLNGGEGLILKHEHNMYKLNRSTLKEGKVFKMKDEFNWYEGIIIDVLEGTQVMEGIPGGFNELGYATTSKSKFDREQSGRAKGFLVEWITKLEDTDIVPKGRLTVTLKGFDNPAKYQLLMSKKLWIGRTINFIGMKPTKLNGVPRQAKYILKTK